MLALWSCGRGASVAQMSIDARNWALFDIENWTPVNSCPETRTGWVVQAVHRRCLLTHLGKLLVIPGLACSV
jgi:hypothetical protein